MGLEQYHQKTLNNYRVIEFIARLHHREIIKIYADIYTQQTI